MSGLPAIRARAESVFLADAPEPYLNSAMLVPLARDVLALLDVAEAAEKEHGLFHPDGQQEMYDGSLRSCPVCSALSRVGDGEEAA